MELEQGRICEYFDRTHQLHLVETANLIENELVKVELSDYSRTIFASLSPLQLPATFIKFFVSSLVLQQDLAEGDQLVWQELVQIISERPQEQARDLGTNFGFLSSEGEGDEGIIDLSDGDCINVISNDSVEDLHSVARAAQSEYPGEIYSLLSLNNVRVKFDTLFEAPEKGLRNLFRVVIQS